MDAAFYNPAEKAGLREAVADFGSAFQRGKAHELISNVHRLCAAIDNYVLSGGENPKEILAPAWELHAQSPFIQRLQTWPRGYQGDFETIEWLADGSPRVAPSDPAFWLEWYALNCPIAQQHRNKLVWQRGIIERAALRGGKILNIGCGGCADLAGDPPFLKNCEFVLVDMDQDALTLASERLKNAGCVHLVQRDVLRGVRAALKLGPFDAIVSGGLFDYVPPRLVSRLLEQLVSALNKDGCLAFTNIADVNNYRTWIEYLADWRLIHRSEDDMRQIIREAGIDEGRLLLERDTSGLTFLCTISPFAERYSSP